MLNRLLKSFALAAGFLGIIYFLTKDRQSSPVSPSIMMQQTPSSSSPHDDAEPVKPSEVPSSPHQCVLEVLPDIAEACLPSVVSINTVQIRKNNKSGKQREKIIIPGPFGELFKDFFNFDNLPQTPRQIESQGSGFVINVDKNGKSQNVVITNYHVVKEEIEGSINSISVTFHNGTKMNMTIMAKDSKSDIAVLTPKDPKDQKTLNQSTYLISGDSAAIRPGQQVLALGNPFGLGSTVTAGIISYTKGRDIPSTADNSKYINILPSLIQHSAQINFGSSGGVLVGLFREDGKWVGKIIGINTAIYTPSGGNVGVGFSIPWNMALAKIKLMMQYGRVVYGWLGVVIRPMQDVEKQNFGIKEPNTFMIEDVMDNSPASKAGLKKGDVIVSYNGQILDKDVRLEQLVNQTKPGTHVEIGVYRNKNFSKIIQVKVLIEENKMPEERPIDTGKERIEELSVSAETYFNKDGMADGCVLEFDDESFNIALSEGLNPNQPIVIDSIYVPTGSKSFEEQKVKTVGDLKKIVKKLRENGVEKVNCQVKISETRTIIRPLIIAPKSR